jgi:hypothetical protein
MTSQRCPATAPICLFFLALGGIFGLVSLIFFLNHRYMVPTDCQSTNITVKLETCYRSVSILSITAYPYTGRVKFCYPVLYCYAVGDCRNSTFCHWKEKTCGLTVDQLQSDLSSQYPLGSYTPCWYWDDSNTEGALSYYPIYFQERYTDYGILFILTCVCLGTILLTLGVGALSGCVKNRRSNPSIQ